MIFKLFESGANRLGNRKELVSIARTEGTGKDIANLHLQTNPALVFNLFGTQLTDSNHLRERRIIPRPNESRSFLSLRLGYTRSRRCQPPPESDQGETNTHP